MANEGTLDRTLRVILGLVLVSLVFVGPASPSGLVGFCPLYRVLGVSTRPPSQRAGAA